MTKRYLEISKWLARTNFFFPYLPLHSLQTSYHDFQNFIMIKFPFYILLYFRLLHLHLHLHFLSYAQIFFIFVTMTNECFILFSLSCSLLSPLLVLTFDYWYCARYPSYDTSKSDKLGENRQPNRENLKSKIKWSGWEFRTPRAAWL